MGVKAPVTLYGIRNCDTMRRARAWLDAHDVPCRFHDYRVEGVDQARLTAWIAVHGWERLLNRAGTTFRALPPEVRASLDEARAGALMTAHPALIRRPVLAFGDRVLVGFSPEAYAEVWPPPR